MTIDPFDAGFATQASASSPRRPAKLAPEAWSKVGSWIQPFTVGEPYFEAYPQSSDPSGSHTAD